MIYQYSFDPDNNVVFVYDNTGVVSTFIIVGMPIRAAVRKLWELMCQHDGMPIDTKFDCFSDNNPFESAYNKAFKQLRKA